MTVINGIAVYNQVLTANSVRHCECNEAISW